MRIAHISDVHIRNVKRHDEYKRVFEDLLTKLNLIQPDVIVNTGDTAHTKTQLSPEFFEMASEHYKLLSTVKNRNGDPTLYVSILGNHDFNMRNPARQDAISPVIKSIMLDNVILLKESGKWRPFNDEFVFWVFSLADQENYPTVEDYDQNDVNIGLFHGSVRDCVVDSNWRMTNTEHDIEIFDGLDYVLMGDIHKRQFFRDKRIGYAGSLIQQNFGEDPEKGFLVWDINGKNDHFVDFVEAKGARNYYTIRLGDDFTFPSVNIPKDSRVRLIPNSEISLVEKKVVETKARKLYEPYDLVVLSPKSISVQDTMVGDNSINNESVRNADVQEKLLRDYLEDRDTQLELVDRVLELNKKYQIEIEKQDITVRDIVWNIKKIAWSNLFNYGENNFVDFSSMKGLTGLFAGNGKGKSNFIDALLLTTFDNTTKGISKNIFSVNNMKDIASSILEFEIDETDYYIERTIEKIKYGQRKFEQPKEWGKTTTEFFSDDGIMKTSFVGTSRPETERNIRQKIGTYEDFLLTSLYAQSNPLDIIFCKETERRKILYRFLDLDVFEQKCTLAKEDGKKYFRKLNEFEEIELETKRAEYEESVLKYENDMLSINAMIYDVREEISSIDDKIEESLTQKIDIDDCDETSPEKLIEIGKKKKEFDETKKALKLKFSDLIKKSKDINNVLVDVDESFYHVKKEEIDEVEKKSTRISNKLISKNHELSSNKKAARLLEEVPCGDMFPKCKFLTNAFVAKNSIDNIQKEIVSLNDEKRELEKRLCQFDSLSKKITEFDVLRNERNFVENDIDRTKLLIENCDLKLNKLLSEKESIREQLLKYERSKDAIEKNRNIDKIVQNLRMSKFNLQNNLKNLQEELNEKNRALGASQAAIESIDRELLEFDDVKKQCDAYTLFVDAMGKDGIAYTILKQKLPLINEEINAVLSTAADFNVTIEHDVEEQSMHIYMQYPGQFKPILIELAGGAQKFLSSMAIRSALLKISNLPKANVFFVDEGFGKLDTKNLEFVQRMFDYLRMVFDNILIVSHIDTMRDIVDNVADISEDDEGFAHMEIG